MGVCVNNLKIAAVNLKEELGKTGTVGATPLLAFSAEWGATAGSTIHRPRSDSLCVHRS